MRVSFWKTERRARATRSPEHALVVSEVLEEVLTDRQRERVVETSA
jgi:hypothetical protein